MSPFFEAPALYQSVLENLPIGIYMLDRAHRVRFWNYRAEQITGYLAHEVLGQPCQESLPHCDPQGRPVRGENCAVTTTLRDGRGFESEVFTLHKQGHRLGIEVRTLPLFDDNDSVAGVVVAFEEATLNAASEFSGTLM